MATDAEIEAVAQAIYDADDTQSGDTVGTVIYSSTHLFEVIGGGETERDAMLRATMIVCRDAARAAIAALDAIRAQDDGWRTMDSAPRDGQTFLALIRGQVRLVSYCVSSIFPAVGFCIADQGAEGYARCEPTYWRPLPAPPKGGE